MTIWSEGLGFPEGPVRLADGSILCVEMAPGTGQVSHVAADGKSKRVVAKTGRPNGLAMDASGAIWIAETRQRALLRMTMDGRCETVAESCDGERFLFLNDVAVGPDGMIYLTDSGVLEDDAAPGGEISPDWPDLSYDGRIYRIDPSSGAATCLARGIQFANGLAFSPEGELFINETFTGNIYRLAADGGMTLHGNVVAVPRAHDELKGPDGMKFAADGRLFACVFGQGDVTVLAPDGSVERRIPVEGHYPTNLVFGAPGEGAIYVTEMETGSIQRIEVGCDGA